LAKTSGEKSPMVGHFPIIMHIGAYVFITNITQHESIPKTNFIWDLKVFGPYPPLKDLSMAI
jgi:hypothetical protein